MHFFFSLHIIVSTEPNTPLNDADHVGSFNLRRNCMGELKEHQPPMTIDEQIENLKSIGLIVNDKECAKKILNDISYFRLVKAYSLNLKPKNGNYDKKTTFKEIVDLYLFNANFRQIIFPEIEKIEINVRCRMVNYFAIQYGVLGYLEAKNFTNEDYHKEILKICSTIYEYAIMKFYI